MEPMIEIAGARVFLGDCRDVLKTLPDNSVDSVVTDPPYGLGFMGKEWDSFGKKGGISDEVRAKQQEKWGTKFAASAKPAKPSDGEMLAFQLWCTEWATECLRVLKPGGHILAFGGSRTWHRLAVAVEDAGFELRDSIAWIYGSGFPKSLDVSKAIDKGQGQNQARQLQFTAWMRASGLTASKARDVLFEAGLITEKSNQASHYFAETMGSQPAIATAEMFRALRPYLPEVPEAIERLVAERTGIEWIAYKQREVIGQTTGVKSPGFAGDRYSVNGGEPVEVPTTLPATPEAKTWQGWGTALKPAFEPVVVGRKPLVGTVAENVLAWGVGGLNIDGSRIAGDPWKASFGTGLAKDKFFTTGDRTEIWKEPHTQGRWPANVILDEVSAGLLDEQSGVSVSKKAERGAGKQETGVYGEWGTLDDTTRGHNDSGGASRFFYVAKASKRDRNEGLEELEKREFSDRKKQNHFATICGKHHTQRDVCKCEHVQMVTNFHPTVKPTQLMRYLIKLVTPAGGVVLDPFTGSGSTGKAALLDGYRFIGAELTEEYLPIIEGRLRWASEQEGEDDDTLF